MVFVLTAGEIDLSIGSIVGDLGAACRRSCCARSSGSSAPPPGLPPARPSAAINGALVAYLRLPSFLVTLATMGLLAGVARWLTDLQSVPITNDTFNNLFGAGTLFGVPSLLDLDGRRRRGRPFLLSRDAASAPMSMPSATMPTARAPSASRSTASASR